MSKRRTQPQCVHKELYSFSHDDPKGHKQHHSALQRKHPCTKIGMPSIQDIDLEVSARIDVTTGKAIIGCGWSRNCFCIVLSFILWGTCRNKAAKEDWLKGFVAALTVAFTRLVMPQRHPTWTICLT